MGTQWPEYYNTLEKWVHEQYEALTASEQRMRQAIIDQSKAAHADSLARKFYEQEMERFQLRASQNLSNTSRIPTETNRVQNPRLFRRYKIPHPCRRIAAELIDMLLILVIKVFLMYNLTGDSPLLEVSKYLSSSLVSGTAEYRTVRRAQLWASSESRKKELSLYKFLMADEEDAADLDGLLYNVDLLLVVDHLGRLIGAIIEAVFISYTFLGRGPGGATIGKWIMNLKVVSCDEIISLPDAVEVFPGTNLGLIRALVRSMLKSTSFLTMFSFLCMLLFRYHRCTYDIIAGTLVVQPVPENVQTENENNHDDRPH